MAEVASDRIDQKENLRDNMTNIELALNMLAEASTTEISKQNNPQTTSDHIFVANSGGKVAKAARTELENRLGRSVLSPSKATDYLPQPDSNPQIDNE